MRRQFGIGLIVDSFPKRIHFDVEGHAPHGLVPADHLVGDTKNHGSTASVRHADRHIDRQPGRIIQASGIPFLEVEILTFQLIGNLDIQLIQEIGNF